ncbi:MAG: serine/threonine protein kinase [Verrucomicrobia bacterium]|nr:serine/threonine protein kinase [Verrucomicrobiota bacterium]
MEQPREQDPNPQEAVDSDALDRLKPGDILGGYQLLTTIARGGVGLVWAARRTGRLGIPQVVAVKTALSLANEHMEQLFFDEARVAASIDHPNVCRVHDLGEEQGVLYLAMDWIDGASLSNLIGAVPERRLDPVLAAYIVAEACSGLHAAHELHDEDGRSLEVIHRDATPQNILLSSKGVVKVTDFGIVKARDQAHDATKTGEVKGKLSYFAPEQLLGKQCDRRLDIFALGAVLYLAVTGQDAFRDANAGATMLKILGGRFEPPRSVVAACPSELDAVIRRALALEPDDRFSTAAEFRAALCEFMENRNAAIGPQDVSQALNQYLGSALTHRRAKIRAAQEQFDSQGFFGRAGATQGAEAWSGEPSLVSGRAARPVTSTPSAVAVDLVQAQSARSARPTLWFMAAIVAAATIAAVALWTGSGKKSVTAASVSDATQAMPAARRQPPSRTAPTDSVTVAIRAVPSSAMLSVDGEPARLGPLQLTAPAGRDARTVEVRAEGYEPKQIIIPFDRSRTEVVRLAPGPRVRTLGRGSVARSSVRRGVQKPAVEKLVSDPFVLPAPQRPPRRSIDVADPFQE